MTYRVVICDSRCFEFPQLNSLLSWIISRQRKNEGKIENDLYLWNYNMWNVFHVTMLIILICEYFEHWILLTSFFYLIFILSVLFTIEFKVIWKILLSNFSKNNNFVNVQSLEMGRLFNSTNLFIDQWLELRWIWWRPCITGLAYKK